MGTRSPWGPGSVELTGTSDKGGLRTIIQNTLVLVKQGFHIIKASITCSIQSREWKNQIDSLNCEKQWLRAKAHWNQDEDPPLTSIACWISPNASKRLFFFFWKWVSLSCGSFAQYFQLWLPSFVHCCSPTCNFRHLLFAILHNFALSG